MSFLILILVMLVLILGAVSGAILPGMRGRAGGNRVRRAADRWLPPEYYLQLHDVTLPTKDGRTTQIDHIILSMYGIFVIETKNYSGWIFGSKEQRYWTQVVYQKKNRFLNPLRQNYGHICALSEFLDLPLSRFHNIVCFAGSADFKTDIPDGVFFGKEYVDYILNFKRTIFSKNEVLNIRKQITEGRLAQGRETDKLHVQNVRIGFQDPVCPRCGKTLKLRTARKGPNVGQTFWGCSGFPSCRFTKPK
ncbi:nuclease-related domain-containing protein [Pontiella agarivorans]|uniref:NERD domain-containing protein n=1 Tax=Pontiella agarivorans TaxID=3038953 RepID=A0ABU5MX40_9BACT|nr:NERD domain-containing protein [Pontiella agarivorans]MDZ8118732.1 NERD domain-containing protein [Pontiella agarivorans]